MIALLFLYRYSAPKTWREWANAGVIQAFIPRWGQWRNFFATAGAAAGAVTGAGRAAPVRIRWRCGGDA